MSEFVRNVRSWNSRPLRTISFRPQAQLTNDAVLLRRLVDSETWPALVTCIDEAMARHKQPFSTKPEHLIGSVMSSIVRDVTDEIFCAIQERAASADEKDVAQVE